jgi:hypothetical protein
MKKVIVTIKNTVNVVVSSAGKDVVEAGRQFRVGRKYGAEFDWNYNLLAFPMTASSYFASFDFDNLIITVDGVDQTEVYAKARELRINEENEKLKNYKLRQAKEELKRLTKELKEFEAGKIQARIAELKKLIEA